jgi:hypothetical protein
MEASGIDQNVTAVQQSAKRPSPDHAATTELTYLSNEAGSNEFVMSI